MALLAVRLQTCPGQGQGEWWLGQRDPRLEREAPQWHFWQHGGGWKSTDAWLGTLPLAGEALADAHVSLRAVCRQRGRTGSGERLDSYSLLAWLMSDAESAVDIL